MVYISVGKSVGAHLVRIHFNFSMHGVLCDKMSLLSCWLMDPFTLVGAVRPDPLPCWRHRWHRALQGRQGHLFHPPCRGIGLGVGPQGTSHQDPRQEKKACLDTDPLRSRQVERLERLTSLVFFQRGKMVGESILSTLKTPGKYLLYHTSP